MQKELADLLMKYMHNDKSYEEFIRSAYEIIISYNDLKEYVKDIKIDHVKDDYSGEYNNIDKIMVVNDTETKLFNQIIADLGGSDYTRRCAKLMEFTSTLIHESDHAMYFREIDNNNPRTIYDLVNYSFYFYAIANKLAYNNIIEKLFLGERIKQSYNMFHDSVPAELSANIYELETCKKIYKELEKCKENNVGVSAHLKGLAARQLHTYNHFYTKTSDGITTSPAYDYCIGVLRKKYNISTDLLEYRENPKQKYKDNNKMYTLEERIKYGLQIANSELDKLKNEESKNIKQYQNNLTRKLIYEKNKQVSILK